MIIANEAPKATTAICVGENPRDFYRQVMHGFTVSNDPGAEFEEMVGELSAWDVVEKDYIYIHKIVQPWGTIFYWVYARYPVHPKLEQFSMGYGNFPSGPDSYMRPLSLSDGPKFGPYLESIAKAFVNYYGEDLL
ncbi:hypothetical protein KC571_01275 [candidate division WWE3 bacterium]|uniref:Uncharacterized protein n=1 Tax=candidate division WWE3 bacterium TaxID=2053526 RepID=A0A955LGS0_UNCKA|nr:hypothetical protein [candidate division WWE3 bacterium]